jgi:hypothetical protein
MYDGWGTGKGVGDGRSDKLVGVDVAEVMVLMPVVCGVCSDSSAATVNNHLCS